MKNLVHAIAFVSLVAASVVLAPAADAQQSCLGRAVTVNLGAGQQPTAGNDVIMGTSGNDTINAGQGDDVVCGGAGNDTYAVDSASDLVTEAVNSTCTPSRRSVRSTTDAASASSRGSSRSLRWKR